MSSKTRWGISNDLNQLAGYPTWELYLPAYLRLTSGIVVLQFFCTSHWCSAGYFWLCLFLHLVLAAGSLSTSSWQNPVAVVYFSTTWVFRGIRNYGECWECSNELEGTRIRVVWDTGRVYLWNRLEGVFGLLGCLCDEKEREPSKGPELMIRMVASAGFPFPLHTLAAMPRGHWGIASPAPQLPYPSR